jgi:hypothetical protein
MCYTNRNRTLEDEARRLRSVDARKDHERDVRSARREEPEKKPLTERVKEMVSTR